MSKFKIGDSVEWESQAGGSKTKKQGKIHYVVPENNSATQRKHIEKYNPGYPPKHNQMFDGLNPRNHESYIVIVESKSGKGKCKLYWPHASKLKLV